MTDTIQATELEVMPDGRATRYFTPEEKAQAKLLIIEELSKGTPFEQLRRDSVNIPNSSTLCQWKKVDEEFAKDFAHARELGYDVIAYDCLAIIDDGRNDWMEKIGKDGQGFGWVLNGEHVQRSKLRFEGRLKLLSKWSKRYADKVQHDVTAKVLVAKVDATLTPEAAAEAYKTLME